MGQVYYIYLHENYKTQLNVGEYTIRPMGPMDLDVIVVMWMLERCCPFHLIPNEFVQERYFYMTRMIPHDPKTPKKMTKKSLQIGVHHKYLVT